MPDETLTPEWDDQDRIEFLNVLIKSDKFKHLSPLQQAVALGNKDKESLTPESRAIIDPLMNKLAGEVF